MWTSLAKPDTAEYQTDVYGDELTSAESLAEGVMRGNLTVKEEGSDSDRPVGQEKEQDGDRKAGKQHGKKQEPT